MLFVPGGPSSAVWPGAAEYEISAPGAAISANPLETRLSRARVAKGLSRQASMMKMRARGRTRSMRLSRASSRSTDSSRTSPSSRRFRSTGNR